MSLAVHMQMVAAAGEHLTRQAVRREMCNVTSNSISRPRQTSTPEKRHSNNNIGRFSSRHDNETTASLRVTVRRCVSLDFGPP